MFWSAENNIFSKFGVKNIRVTGSGGARLWRRHCFLSLKMIFLYEFTASSKASSVGDSSMEYLFFSSEKISENFSPKMLTFRPLYHILPM